MTNVEEMRQHIIKEVAYSMAYCLGFVKQSIPTAKAEQEIDSLIVVVDANAFERGKAAGFAKGAERATSDIAALITAARKEERESIFGKTQEVHFSDGVNGWTGILTTQLPAFPKAEEGKFYLNTDHIAVISTKDAKAE